MTSSNPSPSKAQAKQSPQSLHSLVAAAANVRVDPELASILETASRIGVTSGDKVFASYSSLFLAFLASDDATSRWLRDEMAARKIPDAPILKHRGIEAERLRTIRQTWTPPAPESVKEIRAISVSANTILNEARQIAHESGLSESEPLGPRHVLAAYLFRNPPGHDPHLIREWGFDLESWRRSFARFLQTAYSSEFSRWSSVLSGYLSEQKSDADTVPGQILAEFALDEEAVRILRTLELGSTAGGRTALDSEWLFNAFGNAGDDLSDCKALRAAVGTGWSPAAGPALVSEASSFASGGSSLPLTSELKEILDRARILASETTAGRPFGVRHLIASLILGSTSKGHAMLLRTEVQLTRLRRRMFDAFVGRWYDDDGGRWRFHLIGSRPPAVAEFTADDAEKGTDELDVARFARAFAAVMASKTVDPPLSIGIFGDWGSGKSFFMRLMREETVNVLQTPEIAGLFHQHVVPVRFNAWHYAEANLWASLVQEILQQLHDAMSRSPEGSKLIDRMIEELELAKEARKEAKTRLASAEKERDGLQTELDEKEREAKREADALRKKEADKEFLAAVAKTFATDQRLNQVLVFAETYLNLPNLVARKDSLVADVRELRSTLARIRAVAARSRTSLAWIGAVSFPTAKLCLLVIGALVLGLVLVWFFRDRVGEAWAVASSVLVQLGAISAGLFHWIRKSLAPIESGLDEVESLQHEIDDRLKAAKEDHDAEVQSHKDRLQAAEAEVQSAQESLKAAEDAVLRAAAQVDASTSIRRIARLIHQRIESQDYAKHLGIVSTIRRDFETISSLMKELRRPEEERAPQLAAEEGVDAARLRPIDRIVLYIDDLDRCPSKEVVVVLEAIHLLLAIDLFVVVVGVDIRWAAQSLLERYPQHLRAVSFENGATSATAVAESAPAGDGASALDYLEKIFQIPFWLPPMEESASRELIRALVPVTAKTETESKSAPPGSPAASGAIDGSTTSNVGSTGRTTRPTATLEPGSLRIEASERDFMLGLAAAVGKSPRRLKRFVNTYRILKASLDGLEAEEFVVDGGKTGQYRAAMCLLAMLTGAPRLSIDLLRDLHRLGDEADLKALESTLTELGDDPELGYLRSGLDAYRRTFPPTKEPKLDELRYWGPRVARFSFRSGRG